MTAKKDGTQQNLMGIIKQASAQKKAIAEANAISHAEAEKIRAAADAEAARIRASSAPSL